MKEVSKPSVMDRVAAQLFSVRTAVQTDEDARKAFLKLRDIGYKAVQVSGIGDIEPQKLKSYSEESGLPIVCTHSHFERIFNDLDALMQEHKVYGCNFIGIGGMMPVECRQSYEGAKEFIKKFNAAAEKAEANGFTLGYHNHAFEFVKYNGTRIFDMLIEEMPKVSFIFDTYWVQYGGGDIEEYMKKLKGRLHMLHLKDMAMGTDNKPYITEVLEGNLNFDKIIKTAKEAGTEWYIVEQDTCPADPFDSMKKSYDNLLTRYNNL